MYFTRRLLQAIAVAALSILAAASSETEPQVQVTAAFTETNIFGHVTNGESNRMTLIVDNKSESNITLTSVAGSFQNPDTGALLKNTTALQYGTILVAGSKITIPYTFHSQLKPRDVRLTIWVDYAIDGKKFRASAYDSIVKIVEPEGSFFDFQLLSTYLMIAGILGGGAYLAYNTFVPQKKVKKARVPRSVPEDATASGTGGYQEEWIPAHHIKPKKTEGAASGTESGTDGNVQRRKSKGKRA